MLRSLLCLVAAAGVVVTAPATAALATPSPSSVEAQIDTQWNQLEPIIEKYNDGRDPGFQIKLNRVGGTLVLCYALKPGHNVYQLETRLLSSYPTVPPETRVLSPLKHCPHLLEGQTLCLWRQGSTRTTSRWDPARFTCIFAVQAAWRWLACYEIWHETGEWPLPEAK